MKVLTVRPLTTLTLVLVLSAAAALARPDCNACFMKNAAKDLAHPPSPATPPAEATPPTEARPRADPLVRPARTARAASWDHVDRDLDHNVQDRLRDVLVAENANTAPGQWWDDSPADVVDEAASARWPYRGRWGEFHVGGPLIGRSQNQGGGLSGGAWGDVTDAVAQRARQGFV